MIGRESEIAFLERAFETPSEGLSVVTIRGEAGIGKTTLWESGLARARSAGHRVLSCRPVESEAKLSFSALGDLIQGVAEETLARLPYPQREAIEIALLLTRPRFHPVDRRTLSVGVLNLFRAIAQQAPLTLGVDDIQWIDHPSLTVLLFAFRRVKTEPITVLASLRDGAGHLWNDAAAELGRPVHTIHVGPLTSAETGGLIVSHLGTVLKPPLLRRIHRVAGGNPFFALEVAEIIARGGSRPTLDQPLPVPDDLRDVVRRRFRALSPEAARAILAAAALGRPTVTLVESVVGGAGAVALNEAANAGVIAVQQDVIQFTHPLYASAVYLDAPPDVRRHLHRRIANLVTDPEERARQLAFGTEGTDATVAALLDEAARIADIRGAPDAAAELTGKALLFTPPGFPSERSQRTVAHAEYLFRAGDGERAEEVLEALLISPELAPDRARALLLLALIRGLQSNWHAAEVLLEEALGASGDDLRLRARVEVNLAIACFLSTGSDLAPHLKPGIHLARRTGELRLLGEGMAIEAMQAFVKGRGMNRRQLSRAVALDRCVEHMVILTCPTVLLGAILKWSGDFDGARSALAVVLKKAQDRGDEAAIPYLLFHLAELECWAGNWALAARYSRESLDTAKSSDQETARAGSLYAMALVLACQGELDLAEATATEGLLVAERASLVPVMQYHLSVLGFIELSRDRFEEADGYLARLTDMLLLMGLGETEPAVVRFLPDEVEALIGQGAITRAMTVLQQFEAAAHESKGGWAIATATRCRALLEAARGEFAAAARTAQEAVRLHRGIGQPLELGRALFVQGKVLRRGKSKADAQRSLHEALEVFNTLGASAWAAKASSELARIGGRAARPLDLTEAEARVARLVAAGRRNREVAQELFVSVRTVESTLSSVYRKLGVRSRTELAGTLERTDNT